MDHAFCYLACKQHACARLRSLFSVSYCNLVCLFVGTLAPAWSTPLLGLVRWGFLFVLGLGGGEGRVWRGMGSKGKQQRGPRTKGELYPAMMAASRAVGRASEGGVEDERATANRPACLPVHHRIDPVLLHPNRSRTSLGLCNAAEVRDWLNCFTTSVSANAVVVVVSLGNLRDPDDPRRRGTDGTVCRRRHRAR
jgi:hypothetical protein